MKGGLAASIIAVEALHRLRSAAARARWKFRARRTRSRAVTAAFTTWRSAVGFLPPRVDHVIIPEPLNVDRVCIGHRGVWWAEIATHGRIAHGSMPFLGDCAVRHMHAVLDRFEAELYPALAARSTSDARGADRARAPDFEHQLDSRRPRRIRERISLGLRAAFLPHGDRPPLAHRRGFVERQRSKWCNCSTAWRRSAPASPTASAIFSRSDPR